MQSQSYNEYQMLVETISEKREAAEGDGDGKKKDKP